MHNLALALLLPLLLSSCGGGGVTLAGGGIGGTGIISLGSITALGSIFVNGIEFETTGALVNLDGDDSEDGLLRVGMVVRVEGTVNPDGLTGTAETVSFANNLLGMVTFVDAANNILEVLCQPVQIDGSTVYAGVPGNNLAGLEALADAGDVTVRVSGLADANDTLHATYVEVIGDRPTAGTTGFVSGLNGRDFMLGNLAVAAAGAEFKDFPESGLADGDYVKATGIFDKDTCSLAADQVQNIRAAFAANDELEIEGIIIGVGADRFTISSPAGPIVVGIDGTTAYRGGNAGDLVPGARVEIEGIYTGIDIFAMEVSFGE